MCNIKYIRYTRVLTEGKLNKYVLCIVHGVVSFVVNVFIEISTRQNWKNTTTANFCQAFGMQLENTSVYQLK